MSFKSLVRELKEMRDGMGSILGHEIIQFNASSEGSERHPPSACTWVSAHVSNLLRFHACFRYISWFGFWSRSL
ncbi:hypothetical protein B296_00039167 [Ensete ventricosum]|uniref:Uncharacterized protein n=1 Tax=Ensete ventricosum TaxID=4639 RepID=A0A426YRK1_ENSVE|nr:hypothetical protein B296_00039167 [Ensete ventricosum]